MATVTHIDEALVQLLTSNVDVSLQAGGRVFQVQAPQGTAYPCIVLSRDSQLRQFGDMLSSGGMVRATYTFSCISDTLIAVRNLARAVRAALEYKQTDAIRLTVVTAETEAQELSPGGEQLPIHRTDLTVDVTYTES